MVWLFNKRRRKTLLILTGLIGGSLPKLWPLKDCLNLDILYSILISNESFIICEIHEISESIFFILAGVILILVFNRLKKPIE